MVAHGRFLYRKKSGKYGRVANMAVGYVILKKRFLLTFFNMFNTLITKANI